MATILTSEMWNGTNGSAWPSQWSTTIPTSTTASATIQSNSGQFSVTTGYSSINAYLATMPAVYNSEVLVTINKPSQSSHAGIWLNATGGVNIGNGGGEYPYTGYLLEVFGNIDSFYGVDLFSFVNGVQTGTFQNYTGIAYGDIITVRFNRTNAVIQYKIWLASAAEPATWTASYTDPTPLGVGVAGLGLNNDSTLVPTILFDNFSVSTDYTGVASWIRV